MTVIETLQKELEDEAITTRNMLARIPDEQYQFRPHAKSMDLQQLANHIAELPGWIGMTLHTDELDFAENPYQPTKYDKTVALLAHFEKVLEQGRQDLAAADVSQFEKAWTLREGDVIYSQTTKWDILRMSFSQIIHHRAQLGVYLRLLNVPIPGSYGPSADDELAAA